MFYVPTYTFLPEAMGMYCRTENVETIGKYARR
jgi:hypothetical protein